MIQRINSFLSKEGYTISKVERKDLNNFTISITKAYNNKNPFIGIDEMVKNGEADKYLSVGDKFYIPELVIPSDTELKIKRRTIKNVEVVIIKVNPDSVLFNFEDSLFKTSILLKEEVENIKTFEDSRLYHYLNYNFLANLATAINVQSVSCSLLTEEEVLNSNYFGKRKNRIKLINGEGLSGFWLSTREDTETRLPWFKCYNFQGVLDSEIGYDPRGVSPTFLIF